MKKKPKSIKVWMILFLILICSMGAFSYYLFIPRIITIQFFIEETNEPIDGRVYLNEEYLGFTRNGKLGLPKGNLTIGWIKFNTKYKERSSNFSFYVTTNDLEKDYLTYYISLKELKSYVLNFYINDTSEPLNGDVFLNDKYLGKTKEGKLSLSRDDLFPGEIILNGSYKEEPFQLSFNFDERDLTYHSINFVISKKDLERIIFNASKLDTYFIGKRIFTLVNENREGEDKLRWNEKLTKIAKNYSERMALENFFSHKDPEGKDIYYRLQENKIFYITAAENLYLIENLEPEYDVARKVVDGWMKSPGHRSSIVDRDNLYSDAGVGVFCKEKACYVTLILVGMRKKINGSMEAEYCVCYNIYDPTYPFEYDVNVSISLNATEKLHAYLVSDCSKQMDNCVYRRYIDTIKRYEYVNKVKDLITAKKGYGLLLNTYQYTSFNIIFDYIN